MLADNPADVIVPKDAVDCELAVPQPSLPVLVPDTRLLRLLVEVEDTRSLSLGPSATTATLVDIDNKVVMLVEEEGEVGMYGTVPAIDVSGPDSAIVFEEVTEVPSNEDNLVDEFESRGKRVVGGEFGGDISADWGLKRCQTNRKAKINNINFHYTLIQGRTYTV